MRHHRQNPLFRHVVDHGRDNQLEGLSCVPLIDIIFENPIITYHDVLFSFPSYRRDFSFSDVSCFVSDVIPYCDSVGAGWGKVLVGTGLGWFVGGKIHAQRKEKKLNKKHKEEQKALYTQYYNDVYSLQQQNSELVQALEQLGVKLR
jgi:hypothetical protein